MAKNMMVIYVSRQTDKVNAINKICTAEEIAEWSSVTKDFDCINDFIFWAFR